MIKTVAAKGGGWVHFVVAEQFAAFSSIEQ